MAKFATDLNADATKKQVQDDMAQAKGSTRGTPHFREWSTPCWCSALPEVQGAHRRDA